MAQPPSTVPVAAKSPEQQQQATALSIEHIASVFAKNGGLNSKAAWLLLGAMYFDDTVKRLAKDIDKIIQAGQNNTGKLIHVVFKVLNFARFFRKRDHNLSSNSKRSKQQSNVDQVHACYRSFVKFEPSPTFWNALYTQYKAGDKNIYINALPQFSTRQIDNTSFLTKEIWNNVIVKSPQLTAVISDELTVSMKIEHDVKYITQVLSEIKGSVALTEDTVIKSIIDFIPFPDFCAAFRSKFNPFLTMVEKISRKDSECYTGVYKPFSNSKVERVKYCEHKDDLYSLIVESLLEHDEFTLFPRSDGNKDIWRCYNELYWLSFILKTYRHPGGKEEDFAKAWSKNKKTPMFLGTPVRKNYDHLNIPKCDAIAEQMKDLPDLELVQDWFMSQLIEGKIVDEDPGMTVKLYSDSLTPLEMQSEWMKMVKTMQRLSATQMMNQKSSFGIFTLKVQTTNTKLFRANPEYTPWKTRREELKTMMQNPNMNKDMCAELAKNLAKLDEKAPAEQLAYQKIEHTVVKEHINDTKKDFSTLYLRKEDKAVLENCMFQFKDKKALLRELGIPNKLGIMLYGLPGTGKTSTINAIATYLQKNLYYVNMNCVKTNAHLKLLFDYVNKNCMEGGIIIMEDIDAMTNVVHARSLDAQTNRQLSMAEVLDTQNDVLTLEFFLNILQGSLTVDGSIFICTTNHYEKLDPAFCRDGRFDVKIEMKPADHHQFQEMYCKYFKERIPDDVMNKIPEYTFVPATVLARLALYIHRNATVDEILSPFIK
jgi:hypothetical protein